MSAHPDVSSGYAATTEKVGFGPSSGMVLVAQNSTSTGGDIGDDGEGNVSVFDGGEEEQETVGEDIIAAIDAGQEAILDILTVTIGAILSISAMYALVGILRRFVRSAARG